MFIMGSIASLPVICMNILGVCETQLPGMDISMKGMRK